MAYFLLAINAIQLCMQVVVRGCMRLARSDLALRIARIGTGGQLLHPDTLGHGRVTGAAARDDKYAAPPCSPIHK